MSENETERERVLREELSALVESAASYMDYHSEKFYAELPIKPTGLWPAIERARAVLANKPSGIIGKDARCAVCNTQTIVDIEPFEATTYFCPKCEKIVERKSIV